MGGGGFCRVARSYIYDYPARNKRMDYLSKKAQEAIYIGTLAEAFSGWYTLGMALKFRSKRLAKEQFVDIIYELINMNITYSSFPFPY